MRAEIVSLLSSLLLILPITGGNQLILLYSGSKAQLKPLEINGPTFAEVNETISFIVTSEGLPVKDATVLFAGYEKKTDDRGIATFQVDFAGSFKAIALKEGYETNSTLILVFPKGNEKFSIRSTKSVTDPQLWGDFDYAGRMAGFNYARIKAYYTYDEEGNVYPIIITLGNAEELSDEAVEIIKEKYPGEVPRRNLWIRVPNDVHLGSLAWMISRARDWGFKIFLMAEVLPPSVETGGGEGVPPPRLSQDALKRFLEQRKREAIVLAEFAEKEKVELLDPMGPAWAPEEPEVALGQLSLYRQLLPELRTKFTGKLLVHMIGRIGSLSNYISEYNYSGFDYLGFWFGCGAAHLNTGSPSEWAEAVRRYLNYAESIKDRYNISLLPMYIATFHYDDYEAFNKFMSNFNNSYEDARLWLMNLVFSEISRIDVAGADAHPLWFFQMRSNIPGINANKEADQKFSYWPTRRALNFVVEHFSHPWNREGKFTLIMLWHAELATNSITAKSSIPNLTSWMSELLEKAFEKYRRHEYKSAVGVLHEIFRFFSHIKNPLDINVDGNREDWGNMDPTYFNPSQTFPWFNLVWSYGNNSRVGREVREMGNLKSVYAVNDKENLYLMLDFYHRPPRHLPNIAIDISGNWTHEFGKEFHIPLHDGLTEIWKVAYRSSDFDPQGPGSEKVGVAEVKVGEVVEVKIPLKILGNPKRVNLVVWYPWLAPWGDMEIDIVDWGTPSSESSISMSTSSNKPSLGENVVVSGFIYPAHPNSKLTLIYTMPNGTILTRNIITKALGEFEDVITPSMAGNWSVRASWSGDYDHKGAESQELSFLVLKARTSLSLSTSKGNVREGEEITISGSINPPLAGIALTLTFERPDGTNFTERILTNMDGSFSYTFTLEDVGKWSVYASWPGNNNYKGAISPTISFIVEKPPPPIPPVTISTPSPQPTPTPQELPIGLVITLVLLAGIVVALLTKKRRGRVRRM